MKFREKTKLGGVANTEEEGDWFKRISPGWERGVREWRTLELVSHVPPLTLCVGWPA